MPPQFLATNTAFSSNESSNITIIKTIFLKLLLCKIRFEHIVILNSKFKGQYISVRHLLNVIPNL